MTALETRERHKREVVHLAIESVRPSGDDLGVRPEAPKQSSVRRPLIKLAWPIAMAMLGETALGLVDTKLASGLGSAALGGVGLATTFMFLAYAFVFGLMRGVKIKTSHAVGEGNTNEGLVYARAGMIMGGALGFVVMFVCRDVSPLLRVIGVDAAIIPYAREFLAAVTLGAPAMCVIASLVQHRQAIGDPRTPMIVGLVGNVFNGVLACALIYGHLGFTALGVRGGGYATAITQVLSMGALVTLFVRLEKRSVRSTISLRTAMSSVLDLGLPMGLQWFAETLAFAAFAAIIGSLGQAEIAGHQIALNVIRVSFLPGVAISEAASVMVGNSLGKRDLAMADRVARAALEVAIVFMFICGVLFAVGGSLIAGFFTVDPAVFPIARKLLFVAAIFQVLDAVNIVLRGALRGAKDVKAVALLGIGIVWTCVPTAALLLGKYAGLGALGGWLGFLFETILATILFRMRWKRGAWRKKYS